MSSSIKRLCLALPAVLLVGCASMPEPYIPTQVGSMQDSLAKNGLEIEITPNCTSSPLGEPIAFDIRIRNASDKAFWIAKQPDLLFSWVYPDGRRDNFLRELADQRHYLRTEARLLDPAEEITLRTEIATYYFHRPGITEFRAVLHCAPNTNPNLQPFWCGKAVSNTYGVKFVRPRGGIGRFALST